jgi:hypothetical protein
MEKISLTGIVLYWYASLRLTIFLTACWKEAWFRILVPGTRDEESGGLAREGMDRPLT